MSHREKAGFVWAVIATTALGFVAPVVADDIPDLTLRYRELTGREELRFTSKAQASAKPAGLLNWEFPPVGFATLGFEAAPKTYCIEPLISVLPGVEYPFRVETFGQPRDFAGLKDDEDGRKAAERRAKFVRELYGKYVNAGEKDPVASAAFQTALWELVGETDVPDGPMPFSLFAGTFKADYPNEAASPAFVRTAQKYLQSLTGDDSSFAENPALAASELVRLTGLKTTAGAAAQSQLALRLRAGSSNITGPFSDAAAGPTGGGGGGLGGLLGGGGFRPALGGGGLGGGGGGLGGGSPFFGTGGTTGTTTTGSTGTGTTSTTPTVNPSNPIVTVPIGPTNPQNPAPPTTPETPTTPNTTNPVPAPPAVVLGLIALAAFGGRKTLRRNKKAD